MESYAMTSEPRTILLVEDNRNDETLTILAFRENNLPHRLDVARDGSEALDYLFGTGKYEGRDIQHQPELVLLDIKLPKIDGLEVLRRVRSDSRTQLLPVVVLTSSRQDEDRLQSYQLKANSYVRKPVDYEQFVAVVKQLGLYWLDINERPPNTPQTLPHGSYD
jgi:two-component system response regulator